MRNRNCGNRNRNGNGNVSRAANRIIRSGSVSNSCSGCSALTISDLLTICNQPNGVFQPDTNVRRCSRPALCEFYCGTVYCPAPPEPGTCGCSEL
ncbi:MAG: hypothetical protein WC900_01790 [Oscillospiraceae bacterium]